MLDVLRCWINRCGVDYFHVYISADPFGIEPESNGEWYIKLYTSRIRSRNKRGRFRKINRIQESTISRASFFNEVVKIQERWEEDWFQQDIKTSIILPILKTIYRSEL